MTPDELTPRTTKFLVLGGRFGRLGADCGVAHVRDDLIADVDYSGDFYEQHGPIDTAPYSAEFPFTLQATSSMQGSRLAARTADAVFAGTPRAASLFPAVRLDGVSPSDRLGYTGVALDLQGMAPLT